MTAVRKRGRPKKVGKWKYVLTTGGRDPRNRVTQYYNTDTEVKRAAQKFYRSQEAAAWRYSTPAERAALAKIIVDLDGLFETNNEGSIFQHQLDYDWHTAWGDSGTLWACASIVRVKAEQEVRTNGLL